VSPIASVTVIGIGNPYRRDDGAASKVVARLADRWGDDARVRLLELDGESTRLVQAWEGSSTVWIVDAVRSGRVAGTVHEVDARRLGDLEDSGARIGGGHLLGLGEAVDLARVLDRLPAELRILGIEGVDFGEGEGLSEAVAVGVEVATDLLHRELVAAFGAPAGRSGVSADAGEQFTDR